MPTTNTPYWSAPGATLYLGDVRTCLRAMPARSVHCVVTSPPYWGLRDYGTGTWEGGSAECNHESARQKGRADYGFSEKCQVQAKNPHAGFATYRRLCPSCGAKRMDRQIGAEPSPDCGTHGQAQCGGCFVCSMVGVFSEVRRVLRDDGTLWLNLGDTYADGNLVGVPWRVALALQADGWVLRNDVIWYAPNKMPESVTNRCSKSHEHIFLLTKGNNYYFDGLSIRDPSVDPNRKNYAPGKRIYSEKDYKKSAKDIHRGFGRTGKSHSDYINDGHNKRDVWIVPTRGYPGAHYATFSTQLITPCILAGTSERGCCSTCGRQRERVVVRVGGSEGQVDGDGENRDRSFPSQRNGLPGSGSTLDGTVARRETAGWHKPCGCQTANVVPATVLDPFVGSGTTVATSIELGRHGVGIDLSEQYLREDAVPRIEAAIRGERRPRKPAQVVLPDTPPAPRRLR